MGIIYIILGYVARYISELAKMLVYNILCLASVSISPHQGMNNKQNIWMNTFLFFAKGDVFFTTFGFGYLLFPVNYRSPHFLSSFALKVLISSGDRQRERLPDFCHFAKLFIDPDLLVHSYSDSLFDLQLSSPDTLYHECLITSLLWIHLQI